MEILRLSRLITIFILILPAFVSASTVYSSALLNEADSLVDIVPKQSKILASNYLTQRKLMAQSEKGPSTISRDDSDTRFRTPGSTIDALKILSQAEFNLNNPSESLRYIQQAKQLTEEYKLPYLSLELRLLEIRLNWKIEGSSQSIEANLNQVEQELSSIHNPEQLTKGLNYQLTMLKADIASSQDQIKLAETLYKQAIPFVEQSKNKQTITAYHISLGKHFLNHKIYNKALSELLISYWSAIENTSSLQLAESNRLIGQLFYERRVLDKAADHFSQAADFYDNYEISPILPPILKRMGDIYFDQGKYNLALVHYFNAIDHERLQNNIENVIDIRLALASTYLQLVNFPLADQYLVRAQELLNYIDIPKLQAKALLLEAGLASHQGRPEEVVDKANKALNIALKIKNIGLEKNAYQMLNVGNELLENYQQALRYLQKYNALATIEQQELNLINEDDFRQQKDVVEQTLHLVGQKEQLKKVRSEYHKFQKITLTLFVTCALLFVFLLRRGHIITIQKEEIDDLNNELYAHSRSGLKNLRMLSVKLPASLEASSHKFEKWHVGDLIHEPLSDRLHFVMIDVPFLRNMSLQRGYTEGLKIEKDFGQYLKEKIDHPARVYHFSDANLLYIEPDNGNTTKPEQVFDKIQTWVNEFTKKYGLDNTIRIGMADYPFLPRAYTAINDKELLDILLMSTSVARTLSLEENTSQWVYLKAIKNAPAASLATGNIRKACKHSISQGLIKVHSSYQNEESIKKLLKSG
ncbi:tetratricopeptide repeat protein [Vibrio pectenicida]|uniref:Tetratricopeptide repeat protein n=1 Tax=Vibrio pectenicida TaxID=62763 RepID=A0A3R9F5W7_9VIBR|nr:tetratricopeptide repeat protein [Vibrio pectenicida]RSD30610.1 tetratricopeptide repeat protein [Vibrio pectenicida]